MVFDAAPIGKSFGQVLTDVNTNTAYQAGSTVSAQFVGANPRVRVSDSNYSQRDPLIDYNVFGPHIE